MQNTILNGIQPVNLIFYGKHKHIVKISSLDTYGGVLLYKLMLHSDIIFIFFFLLLILTCLYSQRHIREVYQT